MTGQRTPRRGWLRRLRDEALSLRFEINRWDCRGTVYLERAERTDPRIYLRKREPHEYPENSVKALAAGASNLRGIAWRLNDLANAMDRHCAELDRQAARRSVDS